MQIIIPETQRSEIEQIKAYFEQPTATKALRKYIELFRELKDCDTALKSILNENNKLKEAIRAFHESIETLKRV